VTTLQLGKWAEDRQLLVKCFGDRIDLAGPIVFEIAIPSLDLVYKKWQEGAGGLCHVVSL
jgi:hypothetical protein